MRECKIFIRTKANVRVKSPDPMTFPEDGYVRYHVAFDPENSGLMNCITYDPLGPSPSGIESKVVHISHLL